MVTVLLRRTGDHTVGRCENCVVATVLTPLLIRMLSAAANADIGARVQQPVLQFAVRRRDAAQDDRRGLLRLR